MDSFLKCFRASFWMQSFFLWQPETQLATSKSKKGQALRSGASSWSSHYRIKSFFSFKQRLVLHYRMGCFVSNSPNFVVYEFVDSVGSVRNSFLNVGLSFLLSKEFCKSNIFLPLWRVPMPFSFPAYLLCSFYS